MIQEPLREIRSIREAMNVDLLVHSSVKRNVHCTKILDLVILRDFSFQDALRVVVGFSSVNG